MHASRTKRIRAHPRCFPVNSGITNLDLDITKACNLRCVYCFKGELAGHAKPEMGVELAKAAIEWLIGVSRSATYLNVNLLGGEPTLAWPVIEHLVPYAKRRGLSMGKTIQFGITSNLTLVTPDMLSFAQQWGMGWHLSIDGCPEVQLAQRFAGHSEHIGTIERVARAILSYKPGFCARATFTPPYFSKALDSFLYLRGLGFTNFGFAVSTQKLTAADRAVWLGQVGAIIDEVLALAATGEHLDYGLLTYTLRACDSGRTASCGAGRGYLMIDERGDIWPCHRFDGASAEGNFGTGWCLGNILTGEFDQEKHAWLLDRPWLRVRPQCIGCNVRSLCGGGCPAENLSEAGRVDRPREEYCQLIRDTRSLVLEKFQRCKKDGTAEQLLYLRRILKPTA